MRIKYKSYCRKIIFKFLAVVYLLTYAGLRVEELSNLKLTDLDLEMKRIRIMGKRMKVRTVPISNILLAELEDWLKFRAEMAKKKPHVAESPYVFYSQRSPKFSVRGIQRMIESYSLPNKKLTPHMFRHTFCKWMLKATNNDIEKVRRLAGHSNIATTSRYLKDSYSDLADAVEALLRSRRCRSFNIKTFWCKGCVYLKFIS
jgi:site-specific recombinase XerC